LLHSGRKFDLGTEAVIGVTEEEVWVRLRLKSDSRLGLKEDYKYLIEEREVRFEDMPTEPVTIAPLDAPT
jgi:hypothetical protein